MMCTHHLMIGEVNPGEEYPANCKLCPATRTFPSIREQLDTMEQAVAMGGRFKIGMTRESIKRGQFKKGHNVKKKQLTFKVGHNGRTK